MTRAIYFDMDGTIANLYGVANWLDSLVAEHTKPYREAKPLLNMRQLARELKRLQSLGYVVGIISWLSKNGTTEYNKRVTNAKIKWLEKHLGSVAWDEIHIVEYGTPKYKLTSRSNAILFDDEIGNREAWNEHKNTAYDVTDILTVLRGLE